MTSEQRAARIHHHMYETCEGIAEHAERIVRLEEENAKLKNNNNYLHEMLSESRQANEHLHAELKRHKSILRTRPNAMTALYDENTKLRELVSDMFEEIEAGGFDPMVERRGKRTVYYEEDPYWRVGIRERVRKLGIEVDE